MGPSGSVPGTVRGAAATAWGRLQEKCDILWKVCESCRPRPPRRTRTPSRRRGLAPARLHARH